MTEKPKGLIWNKECSSYATNTKKVVTLKTLTVNSKQIN